MERLLKVGECKGGELKKRDGRGVRSGDALMRVEFGRRESVDLVGVDAQTRGSWGSRKEKGPSRVNASSTILARTGRREESELGEMK